jgi:hypothetical protein
VPNLDEVIRAIRSFSDDDKRKVFAELRDAYVVHALEARWKVRADVILNAIDRGSDLTQRGVRGIIAESIFAIEVVPNAKGWTDNTPAENLPYDVRLSKGQKEVRIQVKMQRRKAGAPLLRAGSFAVEVQKTRSGNDGDNKTRPYRFGDFDLLAVCMEPSVGEWRSFMYASASDLEPRSNDKTAIATFQSVPAFTPETSGIWCGTLETALAKF